MELERNEMPMMSNFMIMIEKEAKKIESSSGEVEFLISRDLLERAIAEERLFMEIEKGKWSAENEPTSTIEEFEQRFGLAE